MGMFRVENYGYKSPVTTLRVLEEDPNIGHEAAKAAANHDPIYVPLIVWRPVIRGMPPHIVLRRFSPQNMSL